MMYCKHGNFSDLTITAIIATQRKPLLKLNAIFSAACYIYIGKKSLNILGVTIRNTADLSEML